MGLSFFFDPAGGAGRVENTFIVTIIELLKRTHGRQVLRDAVKTRF